MSDSPFREIKVACTTCKIDLVRTNLKRDVTADKFVQSAVKAFRDKTKCDHELTLEKYGCEEDN